MFLPSNVCYWCRPFNFDRCDFLFTKNLCLNASQQTYEHEHWIRVGSCWHLNRDKKKKKEKKTKRKLFFFIQLLLCCLCFTCYALHDVFVVWRMRVRVLIVLDALLFHSLLFENWVWFNLIKGDGQVDLLLLFRCPLSTAPFLYRYLVNFSSYSFSGPDMLRKYHTQYPFTITHTHTSQDIYYSENKNKK